MLMELRVRFWILLIVAPSALTFCGRENDNSPCPLCPATFLAVGVVVMSSMDGGIVTGVEATFAGAEAATLSCASSGTAEFCTLPPVAPGGYSLDVTAPGFRPKNVAVSVTINSDPSCGCTLAELLPSEVTLDPFMN
jgi:hypothetical protein